MLTLLLLKKDFYSCPLFYIFVAFLGYHTHVLCIPLYYIKPCRSNKIIFFLRESAPYLKNTFDNPPSLFTRKENYKTLAATILLLF